MSNADASFWGEDSFDMSGYAVSGAGDVNNDGYDDFVIGAYGNDDGGSSAGQTYLILGKAAGWSMDTDLSTADASFIGEDSFDYSGLAVSGAGDVNGDGYDDFVIGAYNNEDGDNAAGQTYLILGKAAGWSMDTDLSTADASFWGENEYDYSGWAVSGAGDVNNDGYDDFLIGAYQNEDGGSYAGQTYLILGKAGGWAMDTDLSNADASFWGEDAGDRSGISVSGAGDVNGDNYDDFLIGAYEDGDGGGRAGQTYLILGKAGGWAIDTDLSNADASFWGEDSFDMSGYAVSGAGDVNNDGYDDFVIGAYYDEDGGNYAGQTYLILGKAAGWSMDTDLSNADASFWGEDTGDNSGYAVSDVGDVNNDGYDDFIIGAYANDDGGSSAGQTYLILGKASSNYTFDTTSASVATAGATGNTVSVESSVDTCPWTAAVDAPADSWITITSGADYIGDDIVTYNVSANSGCTARNGTMTIAGETFTVNQDAGTCSFSLGATFANADPAGDTDSVSVTTSLSCCSWTAVSNNSWITIDPGSESGTGDGTVDFTVDPYSNGVTRIGTLTIAGETFTVSQNASIIVMPAESKITASDIESSDSFSRAVSISGNTAIIGSPFDDDNGTSSGSAYIYNLNPNGTWSQTAKLTASDGAESDNFGRSVAISGDYAIIGAFQDDDNGSDSGAVYIFERDGTETWNEIQKLTAADGAEADSFGWAVSISGNYAVVGAYEDDDNGSRSGSAYIFERDGTGTWSEAQKLTASDGEMEDYFGYSVSISGDYIIAGAYGDNDIGSINYKGCAYIFERSEGVWTETAKLIGSGLHVTSYDHFGFAVSISGNYAIAGAYQYSLEQGAAYIFERDISGSWIQKQELTANDGLFHDYFGYNLSISENYAVIGAWGDDGMWSNSGSAYIFAKDGTGSWIEKTELKASDSATNDNFGFSVSISDNYAVIGAYGDDDQGD